jgi:SAM-dependent methyltransferase
MKPVVRDSLQPAQRKFFMSLRDIGLFIRSARTDAAFERLRLQHGSQKAFDLLYAQKRDPFASTLSRYRYQRLKYERLISFLPNRRYGRVLDLGCGLGSFTRELARWADQVLGVDLSGVAVEQARELSAGQPNIRFEQQDAHCLEQIKEQFDLIALLDVLYYLPDRSDEALKPVAQQVERLLAPGGCLLLANHYFFGVDSASKHTRRIHKVFQAGTSLCLAAEHWRPFFLASIFAKEEPRR